MKSDGRVVGTALSIRQVRTPLASLQTGQMWPSGHGFVSCACATTKKAEMMIPTTVRRTAIHLLPAHEPKAGVASRLMLRGAVHRGFIWIMIGFW
jgi:hypothetical protein